MQQPLGILTLISLTACDPASYSAPHAPQTATTAPERAVRSGPAPPPDAPRAPDSPGPSIDRRLFCDSDVRTGGETKESAQGEAAQLGVTLPGERSSDPAIRQPADIQAVIREQYDVFRKCYQGALGRDRLARGKVTTRLVIQRDGKVTDVCLKDSSLLDPLAVACMLDAWTKLSFPPMAEGKTTVVYPIQFEPE